MTTRPPHYRGTHTRSAHPGRVIIRVGAYLLLAVIAATVAVALGLAAALYAAFA